MNRKVKPAIVTPKAAWGASIILIVFVVGFFFRTWCGVQCIRAGYEVTGALHEQQKLIELQKNLKIELSRLKSPQVLGKIAREQLGLSVPSPEQIIIVQ